MSETMQELRRDVRKGPEELEREADMARDAVEDTLLELEQRFSPSELFDRFSTAVKQNGGEFGTNLLTQMRNNPVPAIMAGIGLAWLMTASKQPPAPRARAYSSGLSDRLSSAADRVSQGMDSAADGISSGMESAMDSVRGAAESARDTAHRAAEAARYAASATTHAASRAADATRRTGNSLRRASTTGAQSVAQCYSYLSREQPLVLGAIAIAAGAALGALLPGTRAEDEWIGETSDAAKSRLKQKARQGLDEIQQAGAEVVEEVKIAAAEVVNDASEPLRAMDAGDANAGDEMHVSSR
jgi:hypothetical protein